MTPVKKFYIVDSTGKMEITDCSTIEEMYEYIDNVYVGPPPQYVGETVLYDITNRPPGF